MVRIVSTEFIDAADMPPESYGDTDGVEWTPNMKSLNKVKEVPPDNLPEKAEGPLTKGKRLV